MIGFEARALKTYIFKTFPKKIGKINLVALAQKLASGDTIFARTGAGAGAGAGM